MESSKNTTVIEDENSKLKQRLVSVFFEKIKKDGIENLQNLEHLEQKSPLRNVCKTWGELKKNWQENISNYKELLELYTNLYKNDKGNEYICHFLERCSTDFGSSRPGTSKHYMIYKTQTGWAKFDGNSCIENDAISTFEQLVFPIFKKIFELDYKSDFNVLKDQIRDICKDEGYNNYSAKQIIHKAVLLSLCNTDSLSTNYPLLFIYKDEIIDKWYKVFRKLYNTNDINFEFEHDNYFEKSNFIVSAFWHIIQESQQYQNHISNSQEKELKKLIIIDYISWVLWSWHTDVDLTFSNPNIILYGAPGTGKTYSVDKFLKANGIDKDNYLKVQFHPNYSYDDFIDGLRPCGITEAGQIKFDLVNGHFKNFCIKARRALEKYLKEYNNSLDNTSNKNIYDNAPKFYFIVDEINRANLSSVLGETLTLLETEYRDDCNGDDYINRKLISTSNSSIAEQLAKTNENIQNQCYFYKKDSNGNVTVKFGIPKNLFFIGMMNDVDKSIDSFDLALRRRFQWIRCTCNYDVIEHELYKLPFKDVNKKNEIIGNYIESCKDLNKYISQELNLGESYEFGQSFFMKISDLLENKFNEKVFKKCKEKLFDNFLRPTLYEYIRAFCTSESEIGEKLKNARCQFVSTDK